MDLNLNDPRAQAAIAALGIVLPIYRAEIADDGSIGFYVYGGHLITWSPPKPKPAPRRVEPASAVAQRTTIPTVSVPGGPTAQPPAPRRKPAPKKEAPSEPIR
ncbi:MAG TPA: hypothetical protein VMX14_13445 [Anaerolineae bacterium]|nr:hypothetical protein [Anaerolineae bacterium]